MMIAEAARSLVLSLIICQVQGLDPNTGELHEFDVPHDQPARSGASSDQSPEWQQRFKELNHNHNVNCGAACLHLLLRLGRIGVPRQELYAAVQTDENGATLKELLRVAESYGLQCEVRRLAVKHLRRLDPPFIIHLTDENASHGHYVVAYRVTKDNLVSVVDATTGTLATMNEGDLYERFSGYALVPSSLNRSVYRWCLWILTGVCIFASGTLALAMRRLIGK